MAFAVTWLSLLKETRFHETTTECIDYIHTDNSVQKPKIADTYEVNIEVAHT